MAREENNLRAHTISISVEQLVSPPDDAMLSSFGPGLVCGALSLRCHGAGEVN